MAKLSNAPKRLDIEAYRGDTLSIPFQARDANGSIDITGYTIVAQIRKKRKADPETATLDVVIDNAGEGRYSALITPALWASIPYGETSNSADSRYVWDVELTSPTGVTTTTHEGAFVVLADVTRTA